VCFVFCFVAGKYSAHRRPHNIIIRLRSAPAGAPPEVVWVRPAAADLHGRARRVSVYYNNVNMYAWEVLVIITIKSITISRESEFR